MLSLLVAALLGASPPSPSLPIVAIDAGHGGDQPGAIGVCGVVEKELTLKVARELGRLLGATGRAVPFLTRERDETVSLEARAERANAAHATLFVSIHANASVREDARGLETYFLSLRAANRRAHEIALRENEGRSLATPTSQGAVGDILGQLLLNAADHESQRFALRVQETLGRELEVGGRGVLQAPFIVLLESKMAAVLVEIGFLTHPEECRLLGTTSYEHRIARALTTAILGHLAQTSALARRD